MDSTALGDRVDVEVRAARGAVLARNAFHLVLGQVASTALAIALNAVLGRRLGAEDFGLYFLITSMSTFAYVIVDWGQQAYMIREVAQRPHDAGVLLGGSLLFRVIAAAVAGTGTVATAWLLGYETRTWVLVGVASVCGLPLALSQPYTYLFRGRDRMDLAALVNVVNKALLVGLALPALFLGGHLLAVITVQGVAGVGALVAAIVLARSIRLARAVTSPGAVRELLRDGAPLAVFFVAISVQPYLDAIVLSKMAPASAVGWYGAARNIMGVLFAPATILATAAFPELSRAASSVPALRSALRHSLRPLLGVGVLGAVGTHLFAPFVITLVYGQGRFDPAGQILQVFAAGLLLFFVGILFATTITAVGRTRELAAAKILSVVLSTALAIFLVPFFQARSGNGGLGLVLAFSITELLMLAACVALAPKGTLDGGTLADLARALGAGAATLALFGIAPTLTPWVAMPACIAVFVAFAFLTGLVRWADIRDLLASGAQERAAG